MSDPLAPTEPTERRYRPDPDVLALAVGPVTPTSRAGRPARASLVPVTVKRLLCGSVVALAVPILACTSRASGGFTPEAAAAVPVAPAPAPVGRFDDAGVTRPVESTTESTSTSTDAPSTSAATPTTGAVPTTRRTPPSSVATTVTTRPPTTRPPTTTAPPTTASPQITAASFLQCVRSRESGGNYQAVNPTSGTGGAYQFHQVTWDETAASIGRSDLVGTRPNQAAPATQDLVAYSLYQTVGAGPWGGWCVPPTDR
jgi:hypothetical protein